MLKVVCLVVIFAYGAYAADSLCGVKDNDEKKTCISVRLPWQETPIYFCTENANIRYKDRCNDRLAYYCPSVTSNQTLLVATPWDCCSLQSTPDICAERQCPSAPYNRTCTEIEPDTRRPWECCSTWFCEEGKISNCQLKRLQPGCMSAPKGKTGCIAFRDEHGCCNKYQCDGEGKPGMCPKHVEAQDFKRMMDTTSNTSTAKPLIEDTSNGTTLAKFRKNAPIATDMRCVGDYNCPGQMKCCSTYMNTYLDDKSANSNRKYNFGYQAFNQPIYGYCMEPVIQETTA